MNLFFDFKIPNFNNLAETLQWYENIFNFKKIEGGINQKGQPWVIIANNDNMIAIFEYPDRSSPKDSNQMGIKNKCPLKSSKFSLLSDYCELKELDGVVTGL